MKTKKDVKKAEKHLSQNVYQLTINYKQRSRSHKHSIVFSITQDKSLVEEVDRLLLCSRERLINIYPFMLGMQLCGYEVGLIPPVQYRIAPAIASCSALLHETISVMPYDVCVADFSFCPTEDNDDNIDDDYLPF